MRSHSNLAVRLLSLCTAFILACNSIPVSAQEMRAESESSVMSETESSSVSVTEESKTEVEESKTEVESLSVVEESTSEIEESKTEVESTSEVEESTSGVEESGTEEPTSEVGESTTVTESTSEVEESDTVVETISEVEETDSGVDETETGTELETETETEELISELETVEFDRDELFAEEFNSERYLRLLSEEQDNTYITIPSGIQFNEWASEALRSAISNGNISNNEYLRYWACTIGSEGVCENLVTSNVDIKNIVWVTSPSIKTYELVANLNDDGSYSYNSLEVIVPITKYEVYHNDAENYSLYMMAAPSSGSVKTKQNKVENEVTDEVKYLNIDTLYIKADSASIRFENGDASCLFRGMDSISRLDESLLKRFDMSTAVNMSEMFSYCNSLTQITIPNTWDTSNVIDMSFMFNGIGIYKKDYVIPEFVSTLKINNLANLRTGNVKNFKSMFRACALKALDVTSFDGRSAEDVSTMFADMYSLEQLTLFDRKAGKSFNPYNAVTMKEMFRNDRNLVTLDLGGFTPIHKNVEITGMLDMDMTMIKAFCPIAAELDEIIQLPGAKSNVKYYDPDMVSYKRMGGTNADRQNPENQTDENRIAPMPSSDVNGQGWIGFDMIDIYFGGAEDDTYEYCDKGSTMKKCAMINGSTINLPKNTLTYKNYFLKGWTTKKGQIGVNSKVEYQPEAIVSFTQPTRLYPVWDRTTFFITFDHQYDVDGDGETEKTVVECDINGALTEEQIPVSIRDNYGVRWYTQPNGKGTQIKPDEVINSAKDITVYAFYVQKFFDVVFNPNGGVGEMESQHFITGNSQYLLPNTFTRDDYTFVGWSKNSREKWNNVTLFDKAKVMDLPDKENSDVTLYAVWVKNTEKNLYHISYDFGVDSNSVNVDSGNPNVYSSSNETDIIINNPIKVIKTLDEAGNVVSENTINFIGWSGTDIDVLSTNTVIKAGSTGDKKYVAHFADEIKNITFMVHGTVYKEDKSVYGGIISEPSIPEQVNESFQCWLTEDGMEYDFSKPVVDNLILYAEYAVITDQNGMDSNISKNDQSEINMVKGQVYYLGIESGKLWTSSNKKVVTIDKKGKMTAKKAGVATISNGDTSYIITVVQPQISAKKLNMVVGETAKLTVDNAPNEYVVSWSSSNEGVVQVIKGNVYAVGTGSAKVTAYINGVKYTSSIKVVNSNAQPKTFEADQTITLYLGQSVTPKWNDKKFKVDTCKFEMSGKVSKTKGKNQKNYVYTNEYIKVDSNSKYKITALNEGTTNITLTSKDKTIIKRITVNTITKVNKADVYLSVGKTYTISTPGISSSKIDWRLATDSEDRSMPELKVNDVAINQLMFARQADLNTVSEGMESPELKGVEVKKNKIKGIAVGDYTIIGEYSVGETVNTYKFRLHVTSPEITSDEYLAQKLNKRGVVQKNRYTLNLGVGTSYAVLPTYTQQNLVWKSSRTAVATIDSNGVVKTKKAGKCNLTTKINGVSVTIELVVTDGGAEVPRSSDFSYKTIKLINNHQFVHISNSGLYYISRK